HSEVKRFRPTCKGRIGDAMAERPSKTKPSWADVKEKLAEFDRPGLLDLIHDLYSANNDNRNFLHTRFGLDENVLRPYKKEIKYWVAPNVFINQEISVSKGKQAISDYKKAIGDPQGLAELMVFYCECVAISPWSMAMPMNHILTRWCGCLS